MRDVRAVIFGSHGETFLVVEWPAPDVAALTDTERKVATLIAAGATNAEVAKARGSSPRTIANHVASIMRKLGVSSRVGIARLMKP